MESQLEVFKAKYEELEAKSSDDRWNATQQIEDLTDKVKKLQQDEGINEVYKKKLDDIKSMHDQLNEERARNQEL